MRIAHSTRHSESETNATYNYATKSETVRDIEPSTHHELTYKADIRRQTTSNYKMLGVSLST